MDPEKKKNILNIAGRIAIIILCRIIDKLFDKNKGKTRREKENDIKSVR